MAQITITELLNNIDLLFNILVPGVLCVWVYAKLSLKKIDSTGYLTLSVSIGFVIKHIVDYLDTMLTQIAIKGFPIVIVYAITGIGFAVLYYKAKNSILFRKIGSTCFGVDTGDNIWTRHIGVDGTGALLHLDDDTYILGTIETVDDDYITLVHYCIADTPDGESMDKAAMHPFCKTVMCVPMKHVKRFEFLYANHNDKIAKYALKNS